MRKIWNRGKETEMKYAIVYSSRTGNTRQLAEEAKACLPKEGCLYCGEVNDEALEADRIYAGFWTDRGSCDERMAVFLGKLKEKEVFLFGTAGFGGSPDYFENILASVKEKLGPDCRVIGTYMCQGRMPASVRERYVKMLQQPDHKPGLEAMIENFDQALSHPDEDDLKIFRKAVEGA